MLHDYSSILFLDCKTTLWENSSNTPKGQYPELIGIDIAIVDTTKNQLKEHEFIYVKPEVSKIGSFCEKQFGISQKDVESKGMSFQEVYRKLRIHYMLKDRMWGCWGAYEKTLFDQQCDAHKLDRLLCQPKHNIQALFNLMTGSNSETTLEDALSHIGKNRSGNIAVDTAQLYLRMAASIRLSSTVKSKIISINSLTRNQAN